MLLTSYGATRRSAVGIRTNVAPSQPRRGVIARDFPRPAFEVEATFQEAQELSQSLKNAPRPSEPKRIAIVGAGLAGLSAAKYLTDAGHVPVVLESRDVLGGKVCIPSFMEDARRVESVLF